MMCHHFSETQGVKLELILTSGKRFVDMAGEFKRGRACCYDLKIFDLVCNDLEGEPDILDPLSLIYEQDLPIPDDGFELCCVGIRQGLPDIGIVAIECDP